MLKIAFIQALLLIAILQVNAASVSFLIIETGLSEGMPISRHSTLWENSLMDVFFESGHIVSNAPRLRLQVAPGEGLPIQAEMDFQDAVEGGMDYFIIAIISHPAPNNVSLRLFSTESEEVLFEHNYTDVTTRSVREELEAVLDEVRVLAAHVR